ncbi:MAG TPA: serine hydrolase [Pyrinomonadaceae bacterium]|nr:serine hydrolase [Chloracidobacterium sp.]MBP9934778.1 serine hydrolase [Pyrinomonadaceae bacterium]HQX56330.1 serine hydrolase [Pyrinomonadaceae bacterium]HQY66335.1 serine hydrolase [Pyrinomonadaceae bacterium]HRA39891.1 serine hydrolase [Pyrinomonadaceae bacterium]
MKKQIFSYFLGLAILVLVLANSAHSQVLTSAEIDLLVERSMKAFDVPGISVGVIKDGKVIYAKGHGVRSLNASAKMDENTLVGIASNSKAFTTVSLGILVDEGKIKWDDRVQDYIPEFKLYNPYVTEDFRIRDLLTHRSGLGLGAGDLMFFPDGSDFTIEDVIHNLRYLKQVSSFRTKYDYDNNLYIVAGEVIRRVSGKSWPEFVEERIMKPLGMTSSAGLFERLQDRSNVIEGHASVEGKVQVIKRSNVRVPAAAGGINSNITDLAKWVGMLLNGAKYNGDKRLISERTLKEIWSPQTIIPVNAPGPYNTHFSAYALGFGVSDVNGYKQVSHTGGLEGMVTQITMIPELNLGIIVLTNQQEGGAFSSITNQIKDGYFGVKGRDWVTDISASRQKSIATAKGITDKVALDIENAQRSGGAVIEAELISGTYTDAWLGDAAIEMKGGKLRFSSKRSPRLTGDLIPYKANTYVVKWDDLSMDADAFVSFSLDENGAAAGFTMRAISPLTDFSYDFHDLDFRRKK